jgi:type IV pilus assembly protein PilV
MVSNRASNSGGSLVEILVSISILGIGLMGMAGVQALVIKANREARQQSIGVQYARELAALVRANPLSGTLQSGNPFVGQFQIGTGGITSPATDGPGDCVGANAASGCNGLTEIAKTQIANWLERVSKDLPGARIDTCFDTAPYDSHGNARWQCTTGPYAPGLFTIKMGWTHLVLDKSATGDAALDRATRPAVIVSLMP